MPDKRDSVAEHVATRVEFGPGGTSVGIGTEGHIIGAAVMVRLYGADRDLTTKQLAARIEAVLRAHVAEIVTVRDAR